VHAKCFYRLALVTAFIFAITNSGLAQTGETSDPVSRQQIQKYEVLKETVRLLEKKMATITQVLEQVKQELSDTVIVMGEIQDHLKVTSLAPFQKPEKSKKESTVVLQSIEVFNVTDRSYRVTLAPGERVRLRAIPHSYDENGNDIGDQVEDFNPEWSSNYGIITPKKGREVTFILPHNIERSTQYYIRVSQENINQDIIKTDVWVNIRR